MANPLRVYFWMLGQDSRLGYLREWGFRPLTRGVYEHQGLYLHQLGLSLAQGLLYSRPPGCFFRVPPGTLPNPDEEPAYPRVSFQGGWKDLWPYLRRYESWLECRNPGYRASLLRICPPALRPLRRAFREAFQIDEIGAFSE